MRGIQKYSKEVFKSVKLIFTNVVNSGTKPETAKQTTPHRKALISNIMKIQLLAFNVICNTND